MGVVRRDGKWTLEKIEDGAYSICERKEEVARIITAEYEPSGFDDLRSSVMKDVFEVRDFSEAEDTFQRYIEEAEQGWGW